MTVQITAVCALIQVFDMLESVAFYRNHLGFDIAQTAPLFEKPYPHINRVLLKRGDAEFMLNTAYEADRRPAARDPIWLRAHRDITLYFGCPDVDAAYEELERSGLSLKPPTITHYGMKQLGFADPDGYGLCLQWPA
ncbi:MAG: VOC family protein [Rhizomicrobium sp.]|jgi:catechol 2,3-dioxygenase-like lactoylglutathione lyase family enzyme